MDALRLQAARMATRYDPPGALRGAGGAAREPAPRAGAATTPEATRAGAPGDEARYNPLARRASGGAHAAPAERESSDEDEEFAPEDRQAAHMRAYYRRLRYQQQQVREVIRQQCQVEAFRAERSHREAVAREMDAIRIEMEREEAKRRGSDAEDDAERGSRRAACAAAALAAALEDGARGGGGGAAWARHEAAWAAFEAAPPAVLTVASVPWPPSEAGLLSALAAREARAGAPDARAAYRRAFRTAALRWHPDKFDARLRSRGPAVAAAAPDAEAVAERVRAVAQALNDAWARVQGDAAP